MSVRRIEALIISVYILCMYSMSMRSLIEAGLRLSIVYIPLFVSWSTFSNLLIEVRSLCGCGGKRHDSTNEKSRSGTPLVATTAASTNSIRSSMGLMLIPLVYLDQQLNPRSQPNPFLAVVLHSQAGEHTNQIGS